MAIAQFKDLCIDATDLDSMADFWADTVGLRRTSREAPVKLVGDEAAQTVWINHVPEAKTVKNRIHIDVHASGPPSTAPFGWRVEADPDGGEFCAFPRDVVPPYRVYEVVVDSVDPRARAEWWASVIGGVVEASEEGWFSVEQVPGLPFECFVFVAVPEPKTVKNRVHWDIETALGTDALVAHGAQILRLPDSDIEWTIMADPEGNEFCVFSSESAAS